MSGQGPVRVVLVGAGHLGSYHLAKVLASPRAQLVAVVEPDEARRQRAAATVAAAQPTRPVPQYLARLDGPEADALQADAALVAAPTPLHPPLAIACLRRGWHVLVEKPLAGDVAGCTAILDAARRADKFVQVGHLERYNPAVQAALVDMRRARYVVAERLGPFSGRSADVDVVFDLMVHDLDLLLHTLGDEVVEVRAVGVPVLTEAVDMASARLVFAGGAVAQLTAGRVSLAACRKLRLFTKDRYVSVDCLRGEAQAVLRTPPARGERWPSVKGKVLAVAALTDALGAQDEAFFAAVAAGERPWVDGEAGLRAVRLAQRVKDACVPLDEQTSATNVVAAAPTELVLPYGAGEATAAARGAVQAAQLATFCGVPAL